MSPICCAACPRHLLRPRRLLQQRFRLAGRRRGSASHRRNRQRHESCLQAETDSTQARRHEKRRQWLCYSPPLGGRRWKVARASRVHKGALRTHIGCGGKWRVPGRCSCSKKKKAEAARRLYAAHSDGMHSRSSCLPAHSESPPSGALRVQRECVAFCTVRVARFIAYAALHVHASAASA